MKNYADTHPNARNAYYSDSFFSVDLVELHLEDLRGGNQAKYYCNGGYDIRWDSITAPDAGTITYQSQGDFIGFGGMEENFDVRVGKFTIALSGMTYETLSDFINYEPEGKRVVVYKAFLSKTTGQILDTPIMLFDGQIYGYTVTESPRTCKINVDCASIFADFERSAGRKTNNESNWLFQGVKYDTALEKSSIVANTEYKWGRL
jgi:hypothetical protein